MSAGPAAAQGRRRIFFALWPDAGTRARLEALSGKAHGVFGGRCMRADTLHMTLAFIGDVEPARVDAALATGDGIRPQRAFSMTIDQLRCWHHNRIVWCGPQVVPAALADIASLLREHLSVAGFKIEPRPFAAHATLLRDADCRCTAPEFMSFEWAVSEIVLVEASPAAAGARYGTIGRWALAE